MKAANKHRIRSLLYGLVCLISTVFLATSSYAHDGDKPSSRKEKKQDLGDIRFCLAGTGKTAVDSALIILDRFDHTGAGIVIERVKVDARHRLTLENVPAGKYFAAVYTYGAFREYFTVVIEVRKKRKWGNASVTIRVSDAEWYQLGTAIIPAEDPSRFLYVRR